MKHLLQHRWLLTEVFNPVGSNPHNIPGPTSTSLTVTLTPSQSGNKYQAVFTNQCGTATTSSGAATVFHLCLKDDSTKNWIRFNSATGQYQFTRCSDGFTLSGTGRMTSASGIITVTDAEPDRKVTAGFNPGSRTGKATITLIPAPGVYQTITVNQTNPNAKCSCE